MDAAALKGIAADTDSLAAAQTRWWWAARAALEAMVGLGITAASAKEADTLRPRYHGCAVFDIVLLQFFN
jgi:hypothetical protein